MLVEVFFSEMARFKKVDPIKGFQKWGIQVLSTTCTEKKLTSKSGSMFSKVSLTPKFVWGFDFVSQI